MAMNIKGIEFHDMPYCDGSGGTAGITYHPFDGIPAVPADFEPDGDVDLADFSKIGLHWQSTNCGTCGGYDLTGDSNVDMDDLAEFAYWWLF
jgi:hypothetical protein